MTKHYKDEQIYTFAEFERIRQEGEKLLDCWKTPNEHCRLYGIEMYPHEGGLLVEGMEERQWAYFTCKVCHYQWSIWKIERRINRKKIWDKIYKQMGEENEDGTD